ncbi:hypothetical protein EVAR_88140_1 [Eumeta japonica]|uniref:Uncharacterized protein n=1 Tax=Eumeta variegata TaxID=151549 RepID=A0A4C1WP44_EUMVA|nr:hypothetical protein EVAR_88140_1 [Eumeta japonica]
MNRKRLNSSSMPSTSERARLQVNNVNIEEIIESWLNKSDESSANENDYWQSDCDVSSEDEYCGGEEAPACDLDSESSEDGIPLSHIAERTGHQVSVCSDLIDESNISQRCRQYYYDKRRCMKWCAEGPSRTTRTPEQNIVIPIVTIDFSPNSLPSQLFGLLITDSIKSQII